MTPVENSLSLAWNGRRNVNLFWLLFFFLNIGLTRKVVAFISILYLIMWMVA